MRLSMKNGADEDGDEPSLSRGTSQLSAESQDIRRQRQVESSAIAVRDILAAVPFEDPDREGLRKTPQRFAKAFADLTSGYSRVLDDEVGEAIFGEEAHDEMVIMEGIPVYSLCEHHLLPFFGHAYIAYHPDPKVGIIGLSKFSRIVDVLARRLQVQERLTTEIMEGINRLVRPKGVAVILKCRHLCMEMRGVKCQGVNTITKQKCGVFCDAATFGEFCSLVNFSETVEQATQIIESPEEKLNSILDEMSEHEDRNSGGQPPPGVEPSGCVSLHPREEHLYQSNACDDYRLYIGCAKEEASTIANFIQEAVTGPLSLQKVGGLSVLDVGAGSGRVLQALCAVDSTIKVARYSAFEMDENLYDELRLTAIGLGFEQDNSLMSCSQFDLETSVEDVGGYADVVLLSHCLYGTENKVELVEHALRFVGPGGVLLIVHRWDSGGTLDMICESCTSKSLIHHCRIWDSQLDLSYLDATQRLSLYRYTKGDIPLDKRQTSAKRVMGYIAIEPHSCTLGQHEQIASSIHEASGQVGYFARKKKPAVVVKPTTVVGIQACLRAASLHSIGNGKVTVLGGGHSENAFADNAIVINMQLWNQVEVDPIRRLVRVGGGAKSGEVMAKCEEHGLACPLGDRPGVGAGLILQGGLNHFMRRFGLAADNVVRVLYVNAAGDVQEATTDEELFPFRGAGSNFGVVMEVTLRAFRLSSILAQDVEYALTGDAGSQVLTTYSQEAESLPETACLDGFLLWSGHDQLSFATSYFNTRKQVEMEMQSNSCGVILPVKVKATRGVPSINTPSQLYDRELYMTAAFAPERVLAPNQPAPRKLRSMKKCVFLPSLKSTHESILIRVMQKATTKWSYVHLLHGGGAVSRVPEDKSAFGCRDWVFAAVITARWPDGDVQMEEAAANWLEHSTNLLLPYAKGVYGADLGPEDKSLARRAFGLNTLRLAEMKRKADPLNVLGCACPLVGDSDPRLQARGVVVIFCGPRCSGKDWLAKVAETTLRQLLGNSDDNSVAISSISDETKRKYAEENPSVDAEKLISDRDYKEKHRMSLSAFYQKKRAEDVTYDAKCYVNVIQKSNGGSILLLTGMRDGLNYARSLAGKHVVFVKVNACDEAKQSRGWIYDPVIDNSEGECAVAIKDDAFWDLSFENNLARNAASAEDWVREVLIPCILKTCTRSIPNTPQPGVQYQDIIGSLLLQPFAVSLWSSLVLNWIKKNGDMSSVDAIVAPEALGFVFAGSIASLLNKPLVLMRKEGKLMGDVHSISYDGSNMEKLKREEDSEEDKSRGMNCSFEIIAGAIVPGQHILVVDDCIASGSTLQAVLDLVAQQGGTVTKLACLMELPDLMGRPKQSIDVFSVMQFPGK